jgi:hypothetical protein
MPRKAPNEVVEHRISLSNFERDLLVRTIEKQQENQLWTAGINQVGQIAGSGVLLYGLATYFGISILDKGYDTVKDWVNKTSTTLSDVVGGIFGIPTSAQAEYIRQGFDALDKIIVEMRERENANRARFDGGMSQLRAGEITYDEFYNDIFLPVKAEEEQINSIRAEVVEARQKLLEYQDQIYEQRLFDGWPDLSGNVPFDILRAIQGV